MNLVEVAEEIQHRIIHIFGRDVDGRRSTNGGSDVLDHDLHFRDYVWFYEVSLAPLHPTGDDLTIVPSISTVMTEGDLVPPTRLVGRGWWRTISFKVGPPVVSPRLQRVRFMSYLLLFDGMTPTELRAFDSTSELGPPLL